jgi:tungstate transport system substrate-binding protein
MRVFRVVPTALLLLSAAACSPAAVEPVTVRLATTTSTYDSGLLGSLLPGFEEAFDVEVDVVAVGTGQAIAIGRSGDADVILVHNRMLEDAFVTDGYGLERLPVMFNDFVLVGPAADPAGIAGAASAAEALQRIYRSQATFVSRGDDSGTYARELTLWQAAGVSPAVTDEWYRSIGQGMGETLQFAHESLGYTLSDRGTFLSVQDTIPELTILFGGGTIDDNPDPNLLNPYGVIQVTPRDPAAPRTSKARALVEWLTSIEAQEQIQIFGIDRFGQPLFHPASIEWCRSRGGESPGCAP